jgi:serine/threonine-protein kinase RsbT
VTPPATARESRTICEIAAESSLLAVRADLRAAAVDVGLGVVAQTKVVTAASELARNILRYATKGTMVVERVQKDDRVGLRATFNDDGPGIHDIDLAMRDGYSSSHGMGIGLPGAKRLVDDFHIESDGNSGTTIVITVWT